MAFYRKYKFLISLLCLLCFCSFMFFTAPAPAEAMPLVIPLSIKLVMALIAVCGFTYYTDQDLYYAAAEFFENAGQQIVDGINNIAALGVGSLAVSFAFFNQFRASFMAHQGVGMGVTEETPIIRDYSGIVAGGSPIGALPRSFFVNGFSSASSTDFHHTFAHMGYVVGSGYSLSLSGVTVSSEPFGYYADLSFTGTHVKLSLFDKDMNLLVSTLSATGGSRYSFYPGLTTDIELPHNSYWIVANDSILFFLACKRSAIYNYPVWWKYLRIDWSLVGVDQPYSQTGLTGVYNPAVANSVVNEWSESISLDAANENQAISIPENISAASAADVFTGDLSTAISQALSDAGVVSGVAGQTGILTNILSAVRSIPASLASFFDVSAFNLNFDGFKNLIIKERFPFCIPFDLVNAISVFAANATEYEFSVDLETSYWDLDYTLDLTPYVFYIGFFRYLATAWFALFLALKTRDLIKW